MRNLLKFILEKNYMNLRKKYSLSSIVIKCYLRMKMHIFWLLVLEKFCDFLTQILKLVV